MKLIIDIPKEKYERIIKDSQARMYHTNDLFELIDTLKNGTPLDNDSERAEVQAYFDGQAYGWEEGRKALIEDIKAEIKDRIANELMTTWEEIGMKKALDTIEKYKKEEINE